MPTINYIYHSCYAAMTDNAMVVYDYWHDSEDGKLEQLLADRGERQLYFVVSHFHQDHCNRDIMDIGGARLIVSFDAHKRRHFTADRCAAIMRPGDLYEDENLKLQALRSTDVGMATLVTLPDGTTIYHAGDNNNWFFANDPDEQIRCSADEMEGMFLSNLRELRGHTTSVNHAMFPVDPRLGDEMLRGVCQWLQQVRTDNFYPMHCWQQWDAVSEGIAQLRDLFPETTFHLPQDINEPPVPVEELTAY